jgi:tight adherence protein B
MLLPILFFALVLCAGLTFGLALTVSRRRRRELEQRLRLLSSASESVEPEIESGTLAKPKTKVLQLERLLLLDRDHPWKLEVDPAKLTIAAVAAAALIWPAFHNMLLAPIAVSAAAACLGAYLALRIVVIRERGLMEGAFSALFPDAVDAVARMLRAGLPVTSAFQMVCQEAPPPVDAVFEKLAGQLRIGMPIEDALRLSSQRIRVPDFQFFAVAVVLQQSAGGNLLPTLDALAQMMRNRRATQLKARAATAEVRFSAYVLGALPFVTVAALLAVSPGYLTPLFHDSRGHVILAAAAVGLLVSGLVMRQMMRSVEQP